MTHPRLFHSIAAKLFAALVGGALLTAAVPASAFPVPGASMSSERSAAPARRVAGGGVVELATRRPSRRRAGMYSCRMREVRTRLEREACGADNTRYGRRR